MDITATIIFHREGAFALPALASLREMIAAARSRGLKVEARALLDNADALTRDLVKTRGNWLDEIGEVNFGDLGETRNAGAMAAKGEYLAFFDGDDLWGSDWLHRAHACAIEQPEAGEAILHPSLLYYFYASDFDSHSTSSIPHIGASSFHFFHHASNDSYFDSNALFINNVWSANVFASRELHLRHPYAAVHRQTGFGVEDWSWNIATVHAGIKHQVVPDTVHIIRVKDSGSLGQQNGTEGLLPHLSEQLLPRFS